MLFTNSNTIQIKTNNYYSRFVNQDGDVVSSLNVSIPFKFRKGDDGKDLCVNGKCPYFRILIRNKHPKKL